MMIQSFASGQVVIGGFDGNRISSVEIFPRPSSDACSIPDLPQPRSQHSVSLLSGGKLVVCGGNGGSSFVFGFDTCISWVEGNDSWTPLYTMRYFVLFGFENKLASAKICIVI